MEADKAGMDCPLGYPEKFVEFISTHHAGNVTQYHQVALSSVTATGCDTARVLTLLTTLAGLLAVPHRAGQTIRRVRVRYLLRHPDATVSVSGAVSSAVTGSAIIVVSGPEKDTDLPIEEQVRLLIHHVKNIENQAPSDRSHFAKGP